MENGNIGPIWAVALFREYFCFVPLKGAFLKNLFYYTVITGLYPELPDSDHIDYSLLREEVSASQKSMHVWK